MESTTFNHIPNVTSERVDTIDYYETLFVEILKTLQLYVFSPLHSVISAAGIVTNLFTMIILWKLGIRNSMSVGTMALSCTDFLATSMQFAMCICYIMEYANADWPIDMWSLGVVMLGWVRYISNFIAIFITAMISVERCLCVVLPFTVSNIFTKLRCIAFILALYTLYTILLVIIYTSQEYVWDLKIILGLNNSFTEIRILKVVFTEQSDKLESMVDVVSAISLTSLAQLLLVVSTAWMVYALKSSSKIRQSTTENSQKSTSESKFLFAKSSMLSIRERKLVKVAIILAVVLTLCNIPRYIVIAVQYTLPGIKDGVLKNLYGFLWDISDFFGTINCSSNFVVYWLLNKKFRVQFKELFGHLKDD